MLNLTGIISFRNGLVSLPTFSLEVFQQLFEKVDIKLVEDDNYALYEEDIESDFFHNITFMNFVKIWNSDVERVTALIVKKYNLESTYRTSIGKYKSFSNTLDALYLFLISKKINLLCTSLLIVNLPAIILIYTYIIMWQ